MPTITIQDQDGKEVFTTDLQGGGLGRYFKAATSLRSLVSIARSFGKPLTDLDGARATELALDKDVPVGALGELSIAGGTKFAIGIHTAGSSLLTESDLQAPITVPNGTTYTSVTVEALLKAGIAGTTGAFGFGFKTGTAMRYAYCQPFDTVAQAPTLKDAVATMFASAVFPADADDLTRLPVGAVASVAGDGEITFSGSASLSSSTNLLATPGLPVIGTAALIQGATVGVDAKWTASGEFELRVRKLDPSRLQLSYFRRRGRALHISAKATAGVTATVKGRELLAMLMTAISKNPEPDLLTLVNAGLDDDTIGSIQRAIAASLDRSLTLAAQLQVSALGEHDALAEYEIDVTRLGDTERPALQEALHGRLAAIDAVADQPGRAIRTLSHAVRQLHKRTTSWRINCLGILNVASFVDLVREGTTTFDPISGALTAADKVSARRIRVTDRPLESDPQKLSRVILESLLVTAAYRASRAVDATVFLTAEQVYLEQHGRTSRHDLEDHYRTLIALGLCSAAERDARLGQLSDFGNSTLAIQNRFDADACDAMFIDADGKPRAIGDFERIARMSLAALMPSDDPVRAFRQKPLTSDALWARIRDLGSQNLAALPDQIRHDTRMLALVQGDIVTVKWWARAMHTAASALVEMRTFLASQDPSTLSTNDAFRKKRDELSHALGSVVATTEARFDDPWHVIAMDAAANGKGVLEAAIVSTEFAAHYTDLDVPLAPARARAAATRSRAVLESVGPTAGKPADRDWTADERDLFNRHVVNLRGGVLSTDGSFSSSLDQVQRIFRTHVPEYVQRQKGLMQPARVLFFAHGGLNEEREGLLPVLARRRFWELNGIYPVYFVWETGLRETLVDIVRQAAPTRAERAALTDTSIEQVARPGGRVIWGRMKASAERAAKPDGGSALVAQLAGELWQQTHGEIEYHAIGHSAGSIFHAFFLPLLVAQHPAGAPRVDLRTLHFLAPAITTELFVAQLKALIGSGKPITHLTTYTMLDDLEKNDPSLHPYGKSLLYLVSQAFEEKAPTPILGLQRSLKSDLKLIRFFGLAGTEKVADIAFSKSLDGTPLNARTESTTHGGFDNDVATMTSVLRRVLDVSDDTTVVDYFEDTVPGFDRPGVGVARVSAVV